MWSDRGVLCGSDASCLSLSNVICLGLLNARVLHTKVAVVEGGALYSWGYGGFGALGLGDKDNRATPQRVWLGSSRAVLAASGEAHSLAVAEGGSLWSWGLGERGRLGHGDEEERLTPVQVAAISAVCVSMAAAGGGHRYWLGWN